MPPDRPILRQETGAVTLRYRKGEVMETAEIRIFQCLVFLARSKHQGLEKPK